MSRDWGCNLCYVGKLLLVEGEHTCYNHPLFFSHRNILIGEFFVNFFDFSSRGGQCGRLVLGQTLLSFPQLWSSGLSQVPALLAVASLDRGSVVLVGGNVGSESVVWGEMFLDQKGMDSLPIGSMFMVYLPLFTYIYYILPLENKQMQVNIPYVDGMG